MTGLMTTKQKVARAVKNAIKEKTATANNNLEATVVVSDIVLDTKYDNTNVEIYDKELDATMTLRLNYRTKQNDEWVNSPEREAELNAWLSANLGVSDLVDIHDNKSSVLNKEIKVYYNDSGYVNLEDKESMSFFKPTKLTRDYSSKKAVTITGLVVEKQKLHVTFEMDGVQNYGMGFNKARFSKSSKKSIVDPDMIASAHKRLLETFGTTDIESIVGEKMKMKTKTTSYEGVDYIIPDSFESDECDARMAELDEWKDKHDYSKLTVERAIEYIEEKGMPAHV